MIRTERPAGTDARLVAWKILSDVRRGEFAGRSADRRMAGLDDRDRALARELAFGTIRLRGRLDAELSRLLDRPLSRADPGVLDWLRLGLYQLRETRIPDHASVSSTVQGARSAAGPGAGRLANAVLRRASREGAAPGAFPDPDRDPAGYLAIWGSHPRWLVDRWLARWPLASVRRLVENDNRVPPVTLRMLDTGRVPEAILPPGSGLRLSPLDDVGRLYRLDEGDPAEALRWLPAVVQDPAASAVVDYVGDRFEGPLVDVCAAPGGKAIGLSAARPAARPFVAADSGGGRVRRLLAAVRRVGLDISVVRMDGRRPAVRRAATVILDVPCTGTGVLRRRPDLRWRVTPEDLTALGALQEELLDGAAGLVDTGGLLVYSTCSLEPEENEERVDAFLVRHPEFEREPPRPEWVSGPTVDERGDLRVLPWQRDTDGAYACRLRRVGGKDEGGS